MSHLGLIKEYLKEEDCIKLSYILKDLKNRYF